MKRIGIKKAIEEKIRAMQPNERIASRNAMCMQYNVARSTIDSIMDELVREGVVYTIQGSGTFVSPNTQVDIESSVHQKRTWALLVPDIRSETYPEVYAGLESYTNENNIVLIISNTNDDPIKEYSYIQTLVASNVHGMIITPALKNGNDIKGYQYLKNNNIPFVFWNRSFDYMPDVPQICLNGYFGGYLAAKHLLEKGYQRIAYLAPLRFRSSMDRFFGYCSALNEAGLEINYQHVMLELDENSGKTENDAIFHCADAMLSLSEPPDAFLCFSDWMAVIVARAIVENKKKISDDVGLIGFESAVSIAHQLLDFELTYVSLNSYMSGRLVAETLDKMAQKSKNETSKINVITPKLILKDSCKGPIHRFDNPETV